jgi:hypothetical protein
VTGAQGTAGAAGADGFTNSGSLSLAGGGSSGSWVDSTTLSYFPLTSVAGSTGTIGSADNAVNVSGAISNVVITLSANVNSGAANANFYLYKNGSSVATCSIAAGSATCTINVTGVSSFTKGDTVVIAYKKASGSGTITSKSFTSSATYNWGTAAIS